MKFFNTAGPVNMAEHYKIDPLRRINLEEMLELIHQKKYFVLHAPRQTGKTSCMLALRDYLNEKESYRALYVNVEATQTSRNNVQSAIYAIVRRICTSVEDTLGDNFLLGIYKELVSISPEEALTETLTRWCKHSDRPVVLFIDEIDAMVGDSLISVLRQVRSGYEKRPDAFPVSIVLCGVRDVRDYRIQTSREGIITGGSAFNIKAESLRLGNFTKEEVTELYLQHTEETGQRFEPACFDLIWDYTEGQPWLVNALGYEVVYKMKENRNPAVVITPDLLRCAKENIIQRRETHLDQLTDKLQEARVRSVILPILTSADDTSEEMMPMNDIEYVKDLGLVVKDRRGLRIANAIYREVIPRELTWLTQQQLTQDRLWYLRKDGSIDMEVLLLDFQKFFRKNGDSWLEKYAYKEAGPQLLLQAFLQRVVNGGGYINREYGPGRKRTDLQIMMPYDGGEQEIVIETKIKRGDVEHVIAKGLEQTAEYMDICRTKVI